LWGRLVHSALSRGQRPPWGGFGRIPLTKVGGVKENRSPGRTGAFVSFEKFSKCLLLRRAAGQLEVADARLPACCIGSLAGGSVILVHVLERTVVCGIDIHRSVVAPARVGGSLHAGTVDDRGFAECHLPRRIASESPGVSDSREDIHPIDDTLAEGHIALPIHGNASHPAMHAVTRGIRALLEDIRDATVLSRAISKLQCSTATQQAFCLCGEDFDALQGNGGRL
jgi:hypothetical protein